MRNTQLPVHSQDAGLSADALDSLPPPPESSGAISWPNDNLGRLSQEYGRELGDYELLSEIARGGMGVVYKARQKSLDRIVAVKMIRDSALARPEDVARFHSEATAAARLHHPYIVAIHEVGTHAGRHFFSMDFIEGTSLAEQVRAQSLSPQQVAIVVRQIALAVQAAHDQGVLHRDLKPSNVLIDTHGEPHVTDFGLAKRLDGGLELTYTEQVLGTPSYMPPEQALGQRNKMGFASDVYGLGAILYELLAGRPPFRGESNVATIRQVLDCEPVAPRRLNPSVSRDLETICLKCLEKEPGKRYTSAQALADELDRYLCGAPIQARPLSAISRACRWCRRNPPFAMALALLLALAVGGPAVGIYTTGLLHRARLAEQEHLATQIRSLRSAAPDAVPAIVEELNRRRSQVLPQLVALWDGPTLSDRGRTRLSLFLYAEGAPYAEYALDRLLSSDPQEFGMLRKLLEPFSRPVVEDLWREAGSTELSPRVRNAAAALAVYDPSDERWATHAQRVVEQLLNENSLNAGYWAQHLEPVKRALLPHLCAATRDTSVDRSAQRTLATDVVASYAADDPQLLVALLSVADTRQFQVLFPVLAAHGEPAVDLVEKALDRSLAERAVDWEDDSAEAASANLAVALLRLGRPQRCWPLFAHSPDPTLRTRLIDRLMPLGASAGLVAARLATEPDVSIRRALILALGESPPSAISAALRGRLVDELAVLYRDDSDTGTFAAAEWTLRKWGHDDLLQSLRQQSLDSNSQAPRGRLVTCEGQMMSVVRGPIEFVIGAPPEERARYHPGNSEKQIVVRIPRSFAVALTEVTREEYLRFENDPVIQEERKGQNIWHNEGWSLSFGPDPRCPHVALPWLVAARYCRWLSEKEGIPEEEICFPISRSTNVSMRLPDNYLERTGYRMPTAAEWEYMARAGATTVRYFGRSPALLGKYAWYNSNSAARSWPVASLKPNDFGLFDMHGSVRELTLSRMARKYEPGADGVAVDDQDSNLLIRALDDMQTSGGSYNDHARFIRAGCRETCQAAETGSNHNGLRLVRTLRLPD